ncbi:MAG: hypothetical protein O7C67_19710 [Gammaproteobacteria bacterium]|nr:hypothetical protein [Gammaproteobacteria bacterium]
MAAPTEDGHRGLNGIWQALNAAHWNIEAHAAYAGPLVPSGALGAEAAGLGIVEGGAIPYLPWALEQREQNFQNRMALDPAAKCYMPGVPRANYLPFPFQIVQTPDYILFAYEFAGASRTINMNQPDLEAPAESWMGHSRGHFEGATLVVEVTDQVADTWFDRAGNFHSAELRITERYTPIGPFHLLYEATIEDPKVFARPWKLSMPLYRRMEKDAQLLEFKCIEFVEELMYGHLGTGGPP